MNNYFLKIENMEITKNGKSLKNESCSKVKKMLKMEKYS